MTSPILYAITAGAFVAAVGKTAVLLYFRFNSRERWRRQSRTR